ncbi:hypothetical protein EVAR_47870_1 [Eumeta japonica]|uniref:Uncharacterized protein n=1 Tax=Eumeta variegata TaxID=151549 RepID=A0A4C1ZWP1_EUMVA|nr:hypothetical protein EVAR_47870_1 [Eumeta japonica]
MAIASIHSERVYGRINVTVDPSSSNACVSTCPLGPVTRTGAIFKNAYDADGFCVSGGDYLHLFLSLCSGGARYATTDDIKNKAVISSLDCVELRSLLSS